MKKVFRLISRYFLVLIFSLFGVNLIYKILTPITLNPIVFFLSLIYDTSINGSSILISNFTIEIVPACVAGAAYFLMLTINLLTPLTLNQRIYSLFFLLSSFYIINVYRIFIFSVLYISGFKYFDLAHSVFWYFGSTLLVLLLWFSCIKIFNIKGIPFYSDLKFLLGEIKHD